MKRAVLFFADGTEEIEALTAVDLLRRAGVELTLAGVCGTSLTGAHGIRIEADIPAETIENWDYDMVILPGGMPGTTHLDASPAVEKALSAVSAQGFLAAICAAPMILGKRGYLKGKNAVCYPSFEKYLDGASILTDKVCRDGAVITAAGAGAATEFALTLLSALCGEEKADALRASILA